MNDKPFNIWDKFNFFFIDCDILFRYNLEFLLFSKSLINNHITSLKQFMAQPLSDSKILTRLFTILAKLDQVLLSAKSWTDITQEKEKIVEENIG